MNELFPEEGLSKTEVIEALQSRRQNDLRSDGRAFAFAYDAGADVREVAREAFSACMGINGLDPTVYPSDPNAGPRPAPRALY